MHLSLTHLATLDAIVRHSTMAAAADELGYTAGAVSQQMDVLSRTVGAPVFERVGRHVELTDAGRVVVAALPALLAAEQRLLDDVANLGAAVNDRLIVGTWGSAAATWLAPVLSAVKLAHPGLDLLSHEIDVDDAANAVQRRAVDVAFGLTYPDAPMRREPQTSVLALRRERFGVAVCDDRHDLPARVSLAGLAREDWVLPDPDTQYGQAMLFACRRTGFEPRVRHQVTDTGATFNLVSQSLAIAPATSTMMALAPANVRFVELREDVLRDLVLAVPSEYQHRSALVALVEVIRATVSAGG